MKKLASLVLALALIPSISVVAYADTTEQPEKGEISAAVVVPDSSPQAEETGWFFRTTNDGLLQKRLWSYTYGIWLTDWITVGYVDP